MIKVLSLMSDDSRRYGVGITVPVSGSLLSKERAEFLKGISHEKFEIAAHGFHHDDFSSLDSTALREDLERVRKTFNEYGINPVGYRAPYLRSRSELPQMLSETGFEYNSSDTAVFESPSSENKALFEQIGEIARSVYDTKMHEVGFENLDQRNGIVNFPVTLPDDEMLVDRFGIREEKRLESILEDAIHASLKYNSFVILQIHPERYPMLRDAVLSISKRLMLEGKYSFITLRELSKRFKTQNSSEIHADERKLICMTGDLDIISIWDLLR
jgi:peptidoglycan/xylan/chitin deacetylase (PgdA/CDA1 family)